MSVAPPWRIAFAPQPNAEEIFRRNLAPRFQAISAALDTLDLEAFDAVVPLQISDYAVLATAPALRGRKFVHPSAETVALCCDKQALTEFLATHGFADHVPRLREAGPPYPYVLKRREGWWGKQIRIVRGPDEETAIPPDWFAQELVRSAQEFSAHLLRVGGKILYATSFAFTMPADDCLKGAQAEPLHVRFIPGCAYLDIFAGMLEALDYEGAACIDYKTVNGRPLVFEINPRLGGSVWMDISSFLDAYLAGLGLTPAAPASPFARLRQLHELRRAE